jgi:Family of unknown function (DUF6942)
MTGQTTRCGLGDINARFNVYITNRPPLDEYQYLAGMQPLLEGDIARIALQTGNHWRKIFNVYAKLVFALKTEGFATWQLYRDTFLLRGNSNQALLFSEPDLSQAGLHIVMGRTYAKALQLDATLIAVDADFQIDKNKRLLVVPYFDYRQLSNEKLLRLQALIGSLAHQG